MTHAFNSQRLGWLRRSVGLALLVAVAASPAPASAGRGFAGEDSQGRLNGWYVTISIHLSFLSDVKNRSNVLPTFGYGVDVGHRWNDKAFFVHIEHNLWVRTELRKGIALGALSIAPGFDVIYGDGFVHTSVALGPSILLFDTPLDDAGSVGAFFELKPVGLRWKGNDHVALQLDPLSFAVVAPVLGGIPLIQLEYRTSFTTEVIP